MARETHEDSRICTPIRVFFGESEETRFWLHEPGVNDSALLAGNQAYIRTGSSHGIETFQACQITSVRDHGDRRVFHMTLTDDGFSRSLDNGSKDL